MSGASKGTNFHPSVIRDHNEAIFRSQTRANGQFSGGSLVDLNSVRKICPYVPVTGDVFHLKIRLQVEQGTGRGIEG